MLGVTLFLFWRHIYKKVLVCAVRERILHIALASTEHHRGDFAVEPIKVLGSNLIVGGQLHIVALKTEQ